MNPENLLGKTFACECGKKHSVAIREIIYSESAIREAPEIFGRNFRGKTAALIADQRTYAAAGKMLNESLLKQGWQVDNRLFPMDPTVMTRSATILPLNIYLPVCRSVIFISRPAAGLSVI